MNKEMIPLLSMSVVRHHYIENIEGWRNFAQRITRNTFVKSFLLKRDGNKCQWCECRFIKHPTIHHKTYEHFCSFNLTFTILTPTMDHPAKTRIVPDCKKCSEDNINRFITCMDKLALVHSFCNRKISDKAKEKHLIK